jgi:hypothetical protein
MSSHQGQGDEDDKKPPARKLPNPSLLSDPFQDEKDAEESSWSLSDKKRSAKRSSWSASGSVSMPRSQSAAGIAYRRRNTTTTIPDSKEKRPSVSSRDAYMQGLLSQMQSLEKSLAFSSSPTAQSSPSASTSSITLLSDNAKPHVSSSWNRSIIMPSLHRYHPMDDYMVYLLRRNHIHASNVRLIRDNPRSHDRRRLVSSDIPLVPRSSSTGRDEDDSSSSLDVGGIAECLNRRWRKTSEHTTASTSTATTVSFTSSGTTSASILQQEESFASLDASKQQLSPMKEESPNSVLDLGNATEQPNQTGEAGTKVQNPDSERSVLDRRSPVLEEESQTTQ